MNTRSRWFRALIALGGLTLCAAARAEAHGQLQLQVPETCRSEAAALTERAFPRGLPDGKVALSVELLGERYLATVDTPLGTRTLEGESCAAAVSAGLVFVALSLAPASASAVVGPSDEVGASSVLSPPPREPTRPAAPVAPEPRRHAPLLVRATGLGLWGTGALPGGGFGGAAEASLGRGAWSGIGGLQGWATREAAASVPHTGGRFWLWSGLAGACFIRPSGRLRPGACIGGELGRMHGEGQGVMSSVHARALWAAALARLELRLQVLGGLQLLASAQPELALVRRRFRLEGAGVVHQPNQLSFSAGLGVAYEFSWLR
jgi:hypothetical protein